jgi:hypothetical protein
VNLLQLCVRTRQECGLSGDGPSAVTGQSGIYAKIVNWVLAAHEEIQLRYPTWRFDWAQYSGALAAKAAHDPVADFGVSAKVWDKSETGGYVYPTSSGANARAWLRWVSYDEYRGLALAGNTGFALYVAEAPDHTLKFYPTPSAGFTVVMDYWRKPEVLAANTDTPRLPLQYHMAIVWRAVMFYCGHDESLALYQEARRNYSRLMERMEDTELEPMQTEGPLA